MQRTLTRGTRQVYEALTVPLSDHHRRALDGLLTLREGTKGSGLIWLRQPPGPPKPKHVLTHLERLKTVRELWVPDDLEHAIHQNRLLKLAREGGQMTAQHLRDLEPSRRYATLVAVILDTRAKTAWRWRYANWAASSAHCSRSPGCRMSNCAAARRSA